MRFRLCAALLLPVLIPSTLYSQAAAALRPMTFEDMQRMRRLDDLSLSPDGHWVLFAVTDVDLEQNRKTSHLWVVTTGVGSKPMEEKPITAAQAGEGHGRFSPDGAQVLFQSSRDGEQQVYVASFDPHSGTLGEVRQVTHAAMGADGAMWSPMGKVFCTPHLCIRNAARGPAKRVATVSTQRRRPRAR
jgi:Tol biopolymer transport system component